MDNNFIEKELQEQPLKGQVAVVAGATRGAGRGIACMLGAAGATVYCTGRSVRGKLASGDKRPETIDETAEMVTSYGGKGIAVQVDHLVETQVAALFERVKAEQGKLDILVNDIWGGDEFEQWGKPFWELSFQTGLAMLERGLYTHIITSRYGVPLLVEQKHGLVVEITDGESNQYRGNLFYDLVKSSINRTAMGMAEELKPHNVTAVAVTPGFLRSEAMLDHFGVKEENWQDATEQDPHYIASETPYFLGKAIAALAADPDVHQKTGQALSSGQLSEEYGFTDVDGRHPNWPKYFEQTFGDKSVMDIIKDM